MNGKRSIVSIRLLLFGEAVVFLIAAFVHTGLWVDGYRHREARIAESVLTGALYGTRPRISMSPLDFLHDYR